MVKKNSIPLEEDFYIRKAPEVAQELLGKRLVFNQFSGIITETEAYRGTDDPASHAYLGQTKRSAIMFGSPGYSYVYMIYGMYFCLNIVTEKSGQPAAVLIRGLKLPEINLNGPGKLCRYLQLTTKHNAINLMQNDLFYVTSGIEGVQYNTTSRIGIKQGQDKFWHYTMNN